MGETVRLHHEPTLPAVSPLPPLEAWKVDPAKIKFFKIPKDDRGFVLPYETIEEVLKYFHDDYRWPVSWTKDAPQILRPDDHHFHWSANKYKPNNFSKLGKLATVPLRFRELPTMRGILPRQFHNVLHLTPPPKLPTIGHMEHYLRSHEIATSLFQSAARALSLQTMFDSAVSDAEAGRYIRHYCDIFSSYEQLTAKAIGINAMDILGVEGFELNPSESDIKEVVQRLGSCALLNVPNYTREYFATKQMLAA